MPATTSHLPTQRLRTARPGSPGRRWRLWTLVAGCAVLSGCGAVIPRVTPVLVGYAQRHDPAADQAAMESARSLYVNRCNSCHSLNDPRGYSEAEWHDWLRKMGRKAKLSAAQEASVLVFVLAARETPPEQPQ